MFPVINTVKTQTLESRVNNIPGFMVRYSFVVVAVAVVDVVIVSYCCCYHSSTKVSDGLVVFSIQAAGGWE